MTPPSANPLGRTPVPRSAYYMENSARYDKEAIALQFYPEFPLQINLKNGVFRWSERKLSSQQTYNHLNHKSRVKNSGC